MSKSYAAEKWLLSVIQNTQIDSIKEALISQANPNFLLLEKGITSIHAAIINGNLEAVKILKHGLPNESTQLADYNVVTDKFEPCIVVASNQTTQDKIAIMQEIILHREVCQRSLLDEYVSTCKSTIQDKNLSTSDFGLLAHYASRLCGVDIGKIINDENNDDRYLIHLCQYSGATVYNQVLREDIELEGWTAYEFLPIRIFSLFEILVKLKPDTITAEDSASCCDILRKEILIEIETFKIEQERRAIRDLQDTDKTKKELYTTLAEKFIRNTRNNPNQEFCLASGYKGHAIYLSFTFKDESDILIIRFDNLGVGIDDRHTIKDDMVYPRIIKLEQATSKIDPVKDYITRLFLIKAQVLPKRRPKNATPEQKIKAEENYEQERNKLLSEIYDDSNQLGFVEVLSQQLGLPEQTADTCVATSHQVGLLHRLKNKTFYQWVVCEEKKCIVQDNRKEGALMVTDLNLWKMTPDTFKIPKYFDCCPDEPIFTFIHDLGNIEILFDTEIRTESFSSVERFRKILDKDDHDELKSLCQSLEPENRSNPKTPRVLIALLQMRLGLKETGTVDKLKYLEESRKTIDLALKTNYRDDIQIELYFHYFLGLILYCLNQLDTAEKSFLACLNLSRKYKPASKLAEFTKIALGFLSLEREQYDKACSYFEKTVELSNMDNGVHYPGKVFRFYPEEAFLGLGITSYLKALINNDDLKSAKIYLRKVEHSNNKLFSKAQKYLDLIQTKLSERQQLQPSLQNNGIPIAQSRDSTKRRSSSPKMEQDGKRRKSNSC